MTTAELIIELQKLPPDTEVFVEGDGDANRSGDYFPLLQLHTETLRPLSFGGWDIAGKHSHYWAGPPVSAVTFRPYQ